MKSTTLAAALLASVAIAQPHGAHRRNHRLHQEKRDLVVEWETVWETATVIVDESSTETILPPSRTAEAISEPVPTTTSTPAPGNFFQDPPEEPTTTTTPPVVVTTTSEAPAPPPDTTTEVPPAPSSETTTAAPTTSTAPVPAPEPATSEPPAPVVPSSTAAQPEPAVPTPSSPPSGGVPSNANEGDITYYNVGVGACGYDDTGADETKNIVALPHAFMDAISTATSFGPNQPAHPLCDKTITVQANGKEIECVVRDKCMGCAVNSIDVTPHAFEALFGSLDGGRLEATWWVNE